MAKIKSIILFLTLNSKPVTNFGYDESNNAPVGITSLNATGPAPDGNSPVPDPVPSETTLTTFVQIYDLAVDVAVAVSTSSLSAVNNFPAGGTNFTNAPGTM